MKLRTILVLLVGVWVIVTVLLVLSCYAQTVFVVPPGQALQMTVEKDANDNTVVTVYNLPQLPPPPPLPSFGAARCPVADVTGHYSFGADGEVDNCIEVSGLKAAVAAVTVVSDTLGMWRFPKQDNYYWVVQQVGGRFYFSPFASNSFRITVSYPDGSTDAATVQ